MGRAKHCTPEERRIIVNLRNKNKSYKEIADIVGCSIHMVRNALQWRKSDETRGRPKKTTLNTDRLIIRTAKQEPFMTSSQIKSIVDADISSRTIRRRLQDAKLPARVARKIPYLSKKNIQQRKQFASNHLNWCKGEGIKKWRNILWSDESKINMFGSDGRSFVRRPPGKEFDARYAVKTIKHGGGNIKVWGCFSWYGVGPIYWIKDTMTKEIYLEILKNVMLPYAEDNMPLIWTYQHDNDPKHSARVVKEWFEENRVTVLPWPSQSPDLNPIEHLWGDLKKTIGNRKSSNKQQLWEAVKLSWESIPVERCRKLIESMPRRCEAVLKNNGGATKY